MSDTKQAFDTAIQFISQLRGKFDVTIEVLQSLSAGLVSHPDLAPTSSTTAPVKPPELKRQYRRRAVPEKLHDAVDNSSEAIQFVPRKDSGAKVPSVDELIHAAILESPRTVAEVTDRVMLYRPNADRLTLNKRIRSSVVSGKFRRNDLGQLFHQPATAGTDGTAS